MPSKRLPDADVRKMVEAGMTNKQIADALNGAPWFQSFHPSAIGMWKNRNGYGRTLPRYTELLPWTVRSEDRNKYPAVMLRALAKTRRGKTVPPRYAKFLENWLKKIDDENVVVWYEEDDPAGVYWYYFPRESYDKDVIRRPEDMGRQKK